MKKTVRKMSLSKETLGKLDPKYLSQVQGRQIGTGGCVLSINICSNHETCSSLVVKALQRGGMLPDLDPALTLPADMAKAFDVRP